MRNVCKVLSNTGTVEACQLCKLKQDKRRQFHARVSDSFRIFDKISLDFKTLRTSNAVHKHLMAVLDEVQD